MNRNNILFVVLISIVAFMSCKQKNTEARYSITGNIQNAGKQKLILQELKFENGANVTLDTITLNEDGKFNFSFFNSFFINLKF